MQTDPWRVPAAKANSMTLRELAATVKREYVKSGTRGVCWNCKRELIIIAFGVCSACYNSTREVARLHKSVAEALRAARIPRKTGRPRGPRRVQPVPAQAALKGAKLLYTEARAISRYISRQSEYWNHSSEELTSPSARLLIAVIENALSDLATACNAKLERGRYKGKKQYEAGVASWEETQRLGSESWDFLMSDQLDLYTEMLGLETKWVQQIIRRWVERKQGVRG